MKDFRDVKNEYGYILRWEHPFIEAGEEHKDDCIYIEKINDTNNRIYIVNYEGDVLDEKAKIFIESKTYNGFRDKSSICVYENYVQLFDIMGINKLTTFGELMKEKGFNANKLSIASGVSPMTIGELRRGISEWKNTTTSNAIKLSKALGMTVEEIYNKLY